MYSFHKSMKRELKHKFPSWCSSNEQYATILTNDIDSLLGCTIEQMVKGNKINYFYDFNSMFIGDKNVPYEKLGIDLAFTNGKCWDNHVTRLHKDSKVNTESANINSILDISGDNYFDKYAMSTAILMWSFYDLPLPETKEGKMILLSIDSGFLGHYDSRFKDIHTKYLQLLGFDELTNLLNETTKEEFREIQSKYKLHEHIELDNYGYLHTELPLSMLSEGLNLQLDLPSQPFTLLKRFESKSRPVMGDEIGQLNKNVISFALTNKKFYKYTINKEILI